jgi:hypothetical protein
MLSECPHCHTRVVPLAENVCPACRRNLSDLAGADVNLTSVTLSDSTRLPRVCYRCGAPTERTVSVKRSRPLPGAGLIPSWFVFLFFSIPVAILAWTLRRKARASVLLYLPECAPCSQLGRPKPSHVDFAAGEMTLIVHRAFRDALRALGRP